MRLCLRVGWSIPRSRNQQEGITDVIQLLLAFRNIRTVRWAGASGIIPLARIKDAGAQMRVEMRPETVNDYAADMLDGAILPPVILFDDGIDLWLADGFHRVEANGR